MENKCLFADIGNSTIDLVFCDNFKLKKAKLSASMIDELGAFVHSCLENSLNFVTYISSVDKKGYKNLTKILNKHSLLFYTINKKSMDDFSSQNGYTVINTDILGADLFCDIIATDCSNGLIVVDLGTASKILFVDKEKVFHGCCILPGVFTFQDTLCEKTDLLDKYRVDFTPPLISLKTDECISSGMINGNASLIAGIVNKIKKDYNCQTAKVIITGGNATIIKDKLPSFGLDNCICNLNQVIQGIARCFKIDDYQKLENIL